MKLVYCLECADIFSPGKDRATRCACGYTVAKWYDPARGHLQVASRADRSHLRVLGINNNWLAMATSITESDKLTADEIDDLHRQYNEMTSERAEGYLFKTRNCPIIMAEVIHLNRTDIYYYPDLIKEVPWHGKFDCGKTETTP